MQNINHQEIRLKTIIHVIALCWVCLLGVAHGQEMDTTNLERYLQSRGDMTQFDVETFQKRYGNSVDLKLDDGTIVDLIALKSLGVQEIHFLPQSSCNNQYDYDENGNIKRYIERYGNIVLKTITYDSSGNVLTEERGDVYDAPFSLDEVKALMKRVYDVDLDTLTSKDNPEYRWGEMHFYYNRHHEKYLYYIGIAPPEASGSVGRDIVIDAETGEVTSDRLMYAEY